MNPPPAAPTRAWTPLLDAAAADRAREVVADVATALRDREAVSALDPALATSAVADGAPGVALLFSALARTDESLAEVALDWLDAGLAKVETEMPSASLYSGTVGVGWVLTYLAGRLLGDEDGAEEADELVDLLLRNAPLFSYDVVRGTVGLGVYLLERLPRPSARAGLELTVGRLAETAKETAAGVAWWVDPETVPEERRERFPLGYYDVGMAHGLAGNVAFLAHATAEDVPGARDLLERSVSELLSYRLADDDGPGRYPLLFGPDEKPLGGRAAWCYGDPGVAAALLGAGRALDRDDLVAEAVAVARDAADRDTLDAAGVVDGSICHGAAGLMHLYNRFAQQTGDDRLAAAARLWAERLFEIRRPDPVAGFPMHRAEGYQPRGGWLDGAAGIALALLATIEDDEPGWDALLLLRPVTKGSR